MAAQLGDREELEATVAQKEALITVAQTLEALLECFDDEIAQATLRMQVAEEVAERAQALLATMSTCVDAQSSETNRRAFLLEARDLIPEVRTAIFYSRRDSLAPVLSTLLYCPPFLLPLSRLS